MDVSFTSFRLSQVFFLFRDVQGFGGQAHHHLSCTLYMDHPPKNHHLLALVASFLLWNTRRYFASVFLYKDEGCKLKDEAQTSVKNKQNDTH